MYTSRDRVGDITVLLPGGAGAGLRGAAIRPRWHRDRHDYTNRQSDGISIGDMDFHGVSHAIQHPEPKSHGIANGDRLRAPDGHVHAYSHSHADLDAEPDVHFHAHSY